MTATDPVNVSPVVAGGIFQVQETRREVNPFASGASRFPPTRAVQVIAPLVTPDGHALGTLCVIDKVPRELRPDQKSALRVLARHVMTQLELRRRSHELDHAHKQREQIERDLQKARAELAKARRELRQRKPKAKATRPGAPKKSRR